MTVSDAGGESVENVSQNPGTVLRCDPDRSAADRSESNLKPFRVFIRLSTAGCKSLAKLRGIRGGFEGDSRGIRGDSEFGTSFSSKTFVAAGGIQLRKVFTIKILIKETEAGGRRRASTC